MIAKPREEVWNQITAVDSIPAWYGDWDRCDANAKAGRIEVGTVLKLSKRRLLRVRTARCDVVDLQAPSLLRWIETRPRRAPVLVEFRLSQHRDGTTVSHAKTAGAVRRAS